MTDYSSQVEEVDDGFASGSFVVEVPMFASQFLEVLAPTGLRLATATGFFVLDESGSPFLVTNRHVVTGRHWQTDELDDRTAPSALRFTVPISRDDGRAGFWAQVTVALGYGDERPIWLEHPKFGKSVDVVAISVGHLTHDEFGNALDFVTYPRGEAPARLNIANDVFTIGFPIGFDPLEEAAFPIWTRGSIAWPPRLDWNGRPVFLIDSRTRRGQSGSPVVFYADETMPYVDRTGELTHGPAWGLLGVYTGRLNPESDLGVVWKRSVIDDIIAESSRPHAPSVASLQILLSAAADPDECP